MSKGNITKVTNGKGILVCNYISLQVMSSYKSCKIWTDEKKRTGKDLKLFKVYTINSIKRFFGTNKPLI